MAVAARALEALHAKAGLAHGDIKPDNLFFSRFDDGEEIFKIGDFGLSSDLMSRTSDDSLLDQRRIAFGTPGYIAPEILKSSDDDSFPFDTRVTADVFAIGVTAYEAISGQLPYQLTGHFDPLGPIRNPYVPLTELVRDVPQVVAYVIQRACAVDREERFTTAKELAKAFEQCFRDDGTRNHIHPTPECGTTMSEFASSLASPALVPQEASVAIGKLKNSTTLSHIFRSVTTWAGLAALILICFLFIRLQTDAETVETPHYTKPRIKHGKKRETPGDKRLIADDPTIVALRKHGMPEKVANAVLELNSEWFDLLNSDESTQSLLQDILVRLSLADSSSIGSELLEKHPHLAAVGISLNQGVQSTDVRDGLKASAEHGDPWFINLVIQNPSSSVGEDTIRCWARHRDSLTSMMQHGMFGAERLLLSASAADSVLEQWVDDVLVKRIKNRPQDANRYLAVMLEQLRPVVTRLRESEFRSNFMDRIWPSFLTLIDDDPTLATEFAMNGGVWDVLRLESGEKLLKKYRLVVVPMFSGADRFPEKPDDSAFRAAIVEGLMTGYSPIVKSFSDPDLRKNIGFQSILLKGLSPKHLAIICLEIDKKRPTAHLKFIEDTAQASLKAINAEIDQVDVDKWQIETIFPQAIYARLSIKRLSGESLYGAEKSALMRRVVIDVCLFVVPNVVDLPQFPEYVPNVDPEAVKNVVKHIPTVYDAGQSVISELIRQDQLRALADFQSQKGNSDDLDQHAANQFRAILDQINSTLNSSDRDEFLDVTTARRLFEGLIDADRVSLPALDLRKVRIVRMPDGRLFPKLSANDGIFTNPKVYRFFDQRCQILTSKEEKVHSKELAWRQLISAWLLLGSTKQLPFVSTNSVESQGP